MKALHKELYRESTSLLHSMPRYITAQSSPASSSKGSSQTAISAGGFADSTNPDTDIQISTSLPPRYKRKLISLQTRICSTPGHSSSCSSSSSTATERSSACGPNTLLKPAAEIVTSEKSARAVHEMNMTTTISYADVPATRLSTPSSNSSSATLASATSDNASMLKGAVSLATSTTVSTTLPLHNLEKLADTRYATKEAALSKPQDVAFCLITSTSASSLSSSSSSEHSSYSATHGVAAPIPVLATRTNREQRTREAPPLVPKRVSSRLETRTVSTAPRPPGPKHLEYDYRVAREELSAAIAIAAYDFFGFSVPVRDPAVEARRPGPEDIPILRTHPLVRKAARELDRADAALEEAFERGETMENTPVPDEWRWGSERLSAFEWAYLPPPPPPPPLLEEKKERKPRTRAALPPPPDEPRTRSQKRKASEMETTAETEAETEVERDAVAEAGADEDVRMIDVEIFEDVASGEPAAQATEEKPTLTLALDIGTLESAPCAATLLEAVQSPASFSSAMLPVQSSASTSSTTVLEKRKRGRPRKSLPKSSDATEADSSPLLSGSSSPSTSFQYPSPSSPVSEGASTPASSPQKRGRGRPRKVLASPAVGTTLVLVADGGMEETRAAPQAKLQKI